ncbi:hypothetical protein NBE98_09770 [Clostridium swellfunianum]|uniref:hypothetical protein n=1 Tax=Clostridium swellfunianum TaxID=1367462 RepID=UPI0020308475|nr:hypothetical protein [Clostridium swellfunianum]MCM0648661.1 hypothetical protein [Clostridium swellfunianum]
MSAVDNRLVRMKNYVGSEEYQKSSERCLADMNRAERREYLRKEEKLKKCINSMTPMQLELIEQLAEMKARELADNKIDEFRDTLDRCMTALLILSMPEKNWSDIDLIIDELAELVHEDVTKILQFKNECKGDQEIMNKTMQKYEDDVKVMCEKLVSEGIKQKKAIDELMVAFPKLTKSMLTNAYKKIKSDWDKQLEEDLEVQEAADEIMEIINENEENKEADKILEEVDKFTEQAEKAPVVVCKGNSCKIISEQEETKVEKPMKETKALKVLSMNLQGENGNYKVCQNGVELSNANMILSFENEEQLDRFVDEFKQVFAMKN